MKPATLKRYQAILNLGLKKSKQQIRPVDKNIRYINPEHTVMVDVFHHDKVDEDPSVAFEGGHEIDKLPKTPSEITGPMIVHISRDYLKGIIDNIAPGTEVMLTIGTDYPLKIYGLLDVETAVRAWIAPRIENE